ncbi:Short-chain dehydrogenase [Ornithinimicrobium cerasi]|uniref:Short-chain dehydrogenase n=1 Tax=Ornithinimicrobium cerasi TaxID=2248773 RepID=A0A285VDW9_9MICO|nr:SDR family NAD(P)-dependent oxidoreductase [Ornithinimicrobium cerasi]SOC52183.1 Short-chain dehydrogenase [Ornithinimicrobium cerasi]
MTGGVAPAWPSRDAPVKRSAPVGSRHGGRVLVTGATGGIGYFVAEQLAALGHPVVLAARDPGRAAAARTALREQVPGADVTTIPLDLADLRSVASAVERVAAGAPLEALIANAALVSYGLRPVAPRRTVDGVELHLGTAHLGHYALVSRLLPWLERWGTRVVHVGSLSHRIPLGPDPWTVALRPRREPTLVSYARAKRAVTLFGMQLARELGARGSAATSVLAHPGTAVDVLTPARDGIPASQPTEIGPVSRTLVRAMHGKDGGAAVIVHAATSPLVRSGDWWGPDGAGQLRGDAVRLRPPPAATARHRRSTADLLRLSEELTSTVLGPRPVP